MSDHSNCHFTLLEIKNYLESKGINSHLKGSPEHTVKQLASLQDERVDDKNQCIGFINNSKYSLYLSKTKISTLLLREKDMSFFSGHALIVDNPYLAWAYVSQLFNNQPNKKIGIHPTAIVSESAKIGKNVKIGAYAVIEDEVSIGDNVVIGAHCVIEEKAIIGDHSYLYPRVTICYHCIIGDHVTLHPGVIIGSQGFGFVKDKDYFVDIAQTGKVILEDYVNIGANTTIDRGAIDDTIIKRNSRLDNLVQVAHNVSIGENTIIAGCSAVAGSTSIGNNVMIGGCTAINGHIEITDNVMVTGFTMLTHSIDKPGIYSSGIPVMENKEWHRMIYRIRKLDVIYKKIKEFEEQLGK